MVMGGLGTEMNVKIVVVLSCVCYRMSGKEHVWKKTW